MKPLPKTYAQRPRPAHDCPDCGCYVYSDSFCDYCYALADFVLVKVGNRVLYRGYDNDKAQAIWDEALEAGVRQTPVRVPKWVTVPDVLINNPAPGEVA